MWFSKKNYSFSINKYNAAVERTKEILKVIANKRENVDLDEDEKFDNFMNFWSEKELENHLECQLAYWKKYKKQEEKTKA